MNKIMDLRPPHHNHKPVMMETKQEMLLLVTIRQT